MLAAGRAVMHLAAMASLCPQRPLGAMGRRASRLPPARLGGLRHMRMAAPAAGGAEPAAADAPVRSEFLRTMQWRGFIQQATKLEELDDKLATSTVVAYLGFDATASSLHVGSLLQIMLLRHFQVSVAMDRTAATPGHSP